jgi:hypothetical protein
MPVDANIRTSPINPEDPDGSIAMEQAGMKPRKGLREAIDAAREKEMLSTEYRKANSSPQGMKKGGSVGSASSRGDGIAIRGKTRA